MAKDEQDAAADPEAVLKEDPALGDPPDRGDRVEVSIVFASPSAKDRERLSEIRDLFDEMGIQFDSSAGIDDDGVTEIQWSWDWSLTGPVRVEYVRLHPDEPDEEEARLSEEEAGAGPAADGA